MSSVIQYDVCIIGAGLSGLACCKKLLDSSSLTMCVLEARDRVGGRTYSCPFEDDMYDIGGQWIGPKQLLALQLVELFKLKTEHQKFFEASTNNTLSSGSSTSMTDDELAELNCFIDNLEKLSETVLGPPWQQQCENAALWDSLSADEYFKSNIFHAKVLREMQLLVQTVLATEPARLSFLYFLYYIKCCGGIQQLGDVPGGAQTFKISGGAQQISLCLSKYITEKGAQLYLENGATKLSFDDASQTFMVRGDRVHIQARRIVVALAPTLWNTIDFEPLLPIEKRLISDRMYMGLVIKVITIFETDFWNRSSVDAAVVRAHDIKLTVVSQNVTDEEESSVLETLGPVANVFPATIAGYPALVGLITGSAAEEFEKIPTEEMQRDVIVSQYVKYFSATNRISSNRGAVAAAAELPVVRHFAIKSWMEEKYSKGCFAALMPPGLATQAGDRLRDSCFLVKSKTAAAVNTGETAAVAGEVVLPSVHVLTETSGVDFLADSSNSGTRYTMVYQQPSIAPLLTDAEDKSAADCPCASEENFRSSSVHFTSSELARSWPGYFEGAIESAYRCADEILACCESSKLLHIK
jgi:monoamine oxidase